MNCRNCLHSHLTEERANPRPAVKRVWCPTWVSANSGPLDLCERHAAVFVGDKASWHWAEEADKAFQFCQDFFPPGDERLPNVEGMLKGQHAGRIGDTDIYVCDNQAWLFRAMASLKYAIRLGEVNEAKAMFPKLFEEYEPEAD